MRAQELPADDGQPMLRPEEYTLPGIEAPQLPTEQEYLAETVKQAKNGNKEASTEVLSEFIATVDRHNEHTWLGAIPWPCAQFVADKLRAVLKGDPIDAGREPGYQKQQSRQANWQREIQTYCRRRFLFLACAGWRRPQSREVPDERKHRGKR